VTTQIPVILPGLFTALQAENALPLDRVFVDYGYFDSFRVATQTVNPQAIFGGSTVATTTQGTANLNRFNIGAEKTFLDGRASIYVRVPFLDATNNTANLPIDGLGDISAGLKCVLLADKKTGSVLTAGMTVSAPTSRDQVAVTGVKLVEGPTVTTVEHFPVSPSVAMFTGSQFETITVTGHRTLVQPTTITVNPTFLQPWFAGLWVLDRLYVQDYVGFVLPTDTRVPPILNNDFGVGYQIYRGSPDRFLRFVRPTIDVQLVQPFNHRSGSGSVPTTGNSASSNTSSFDIFEPALDHPTPDRQFNGVFGFPTQVFMAEGMQFGLGNRSLLSAAIVTPLVGPQAFTIGVTVGFNLFF
jgi:hypothetical protein